MYGRLQVGQMKRMEDLVQDSSWITKPRSAARPQIVAYKGAAAGAAGAPRARPVSRAAPPSAVPTQSSTFMGTF